MKGGIGNLMKQAQQMQQKLQEAQQKLANMVVQGKAGASPLEVKIELNGRHDPKRVDIQHPSLSEEEREILGDLVAAAIRDANNKIENTSKKEMEALTSGIKLPTGFDLPLGDG